MMVLSPSPQFQSNNEKIIRQTQVEGYSIKYLTSYLQNCKGHEKQRNMEKPSNTEGA